MKNFGKIIVVGKKGLLAGDLETALSVAEARVQRLGQAELELADHDVDIVVYTSAMTHVDECFRNPWKGVEFTNKYLQQWLDRFSAGGGAHGAGGPPPESEGRSQRAEARGQRSEVGGRSSEVKFIYISTGGIFDGSPRAVKEDEPRAPVHPYGMVKALAEFQVINAGIENWVIVRTDDLFSKNRVLNYPKGAIDKFNKPTYAPDVAAGISRLIEIDFRGIIHICGPELMSKYELVKYFNPDVQPVTLEELGLPSPRPQYENLDTSLAESLGIRVRSVKEALADINCR